MCSEALLMYTWALMSLTPDVYQHSFACDFTVTRLERNVNFQL